MRDRTVGDTFFIAFTTRAFATGIPTTLADSPVVSAYEDAGLTQITAGITLGVDHDGVVGLNMLTIVATGANGYETVKDYNLVITTGTVGGVSVVGEVVGQFSLSLSAAAVDLANGTDGLTALKTGIDAIPTTAMRGTDGVDTATMRGTDSALLASSAPTNFGALGIESDGDLTKVNLCALNTDMITFADIWTTTALTESYASNGSTFTPAQGLYAIHQDRMDFTISGTTYTTRQLNGSSTAFVKTLNDGTNPTASTRT